MSYSCSQISMHYCLKSQPLLLRTLNRIVGCKQRLVYPYNLLGFLQCPSVGAANCMFSLCLRGQRWILQTTAVHLCPTCCCLCEDEEGNGSPYKQPKSKADIVLPTHLPQVCQEKVRKLYSLRSTDLWVLLLVLSCLQLTFSGVSPCTSFMREPAGKESRLIRGRKWGMDVKMPLAVGRRVEFSVQDGLWSTG